MDAHDEFFSLWCEPEAWCERCEEHPAVHMVVQDDESSLESFVTFVRLWDPGTQEYIALCRQCTKEHREAQGTQGLEYVQSTPAPVSSPQKMAGAAKVYQLWQRLWQWGAALFAVVMMFWFRRKLAKHGTSLKPYSHTET